MKFLKILILQVGLITAVGCTKTAIRPKSYASSAVALSCASDLQIPICGSKTNIDVRQQEGGQ